MLHYLPGCDVRTNHGLAVEKMERYMEAQGAFIDKCCRVKKRLLEEGDVIVNNCTMCDMILRETHPDNECQSLYEFVLQDENFPWKDHSGETIAVQDCWRTRGNNALQKAIRECLARMNYTVIEMENNFAKADFCGVWRNNAPAKICIEVAPKTFSAIIENHIRILPVEKQVEMMREQVSRYGNEDVLVYCNGCEKGLKIGGGKPIHMIELLAQGL